MNTNYQYFNSYKTKLFQKKSKKINILFQLKFREKWHTDISSLDIISMIIVLFTSMHFAVAIRTAFDFSCSSLCLRDVTVLSESSFPTSSSLLGSSQQPLLLLRCSFQSLSPGRSHSASDFLGVSDAISNCNRLCFFALVVTWQPVHQ